MLQLGFPILRPSSRGPVWVLLAWLAAPTPLSAQYIYLDANGDGVHSAADVLAPAGETALDVWIVTDRNRDGSTATCVTADGPLTISGYEFILHATNGTILWSKAENRRPEFAVEFGSASSENDRYLAYGGGSGLSPGLYQLATVTATVAGGTPSIAFATSTPLGGIYMTAFTSACSGYDLDNTMKLGSEWTDADGVAYGGVANRAPRLDALADLAVAEGSVLDTELTATDEDGDAVTFELAEGPAYASVTTVDPGAGTARGALRLEPGYDDAGEETARIVASDGLAEGALEVGITVLPTNRPPTLLQLRDMMAPEGETDEQVVQARDLDLDLLAFMPPSFPSYITLETLSASPGDLLGRIRMAPGYDDAGMMTLTVAVTDGVVSTEKSFMVMVRDVNRAPSLMLPDDLTAEEGDLVAFDVVGTDPDGQYVVLGAFDLPEGATFEDRGAGNGRFTWVPGFDQAGSYVVGFDGADGLGGMATGDVAITITEFSGDVALAQPLDMGLVEGTTAEQILRAADASGDGLTFSRVAGPMFVQVTTTNPGTGLAEGLLTAAPGIGMAGDHVVTIAATDGVNRAERALHVLVREAGPGPSPEGPPLAPPFTVIPVGALPHTVTSADLDGDRILDLVVAEMGMNTVSVMRGRGDGTFEPRRSFMTLMMPHTVVVGDLDRNGILDLIVSQMGANRIGVFSGTGRGMFDLRRDYMMPGSPMFVTLGDFDRDGMLDAAATNRTAGAMTYFKGDGTGALTMMREYPTGANAHGMLVGDWNGDKHVDVAVANPNARTVSMLLGRGDGTFRDAINFETTSPHTLASGDCDGDGHEDLIVVNYDDGTVSVALGMGDGSFRPLGDIPTGAHAHGATLSDLDGDFGLDLLVVNEQAATLSVLMGRDDGMFAPKVDFPVGVGAHSVHCADLNRDGAPDVAVSSLQAAEVTVLLNRRLPLRRVRGFTTGSDRNVVLMAREPVVWIGLEPEDGFDAGAIDVASVELVSIGTGERSRARAMEGKGGPVADRDRNGVPEIRVPFSGEDVHALFTRLAGRREVAALVTGLLTTGERFQGKFPLTVVARPKPQPPRVAPNPLNPDGTIYFATEQQGPARVTVYDAAGRFVRELLREPVLPAGAHALRVPSSDAAGRPLASGVYFFRIESGEGVAGGRFVLLK